MTEKEAVENLDKLIECAGWRECNGDCGMCDVAVKVEDALTVFDIAKRSILKVNEIEEYIEMVNKSITEDSDANDNDFNRGILRILDALSDVINGSYHCG